MSYLERLRGGDSEKRPPPVLQELQKGPADSGKRPPSALQELQKAPSYSFCSGHGAYFQKSDPAALTPPAALPWPAELTDALKRVSAAFEWTRQDIADFCRWARLSPEALARASEFLRTEAAKLPPPGVTERRRAVVAMLADDPTLRVAWTCADDGASDPVLLTLAVRGKGACEIAIPRARFDAFALLREVERHGELSMASNSRPGDSQ